MRKYKLPPTDNMRRLHVLINASPCEREAGALSTGASLAVKSVMHRDGSFLPFYSFSVHLEFLFGCIPGRGNQSILRSVFLHAISEIQYKAKWEDASDEIDPGCWAQKQEKGAKPSGRNEMG